MLKESLEMKTRGRGRDRKERGDRMLCTTRRIGFGGMFDAGSRKWLTFRFILQLDIRTHDLGFNKMTDK